MIRVNQKSKLSVLFAAFSIFVFFSITACGVEESGISPPKNAFYNPLGLSAHPNGRFLFVSNAVFDRNYNRSYISVVDTFENKIIEDLTTEVDLFAGELKLNLSCDQVAQGECQKRVIGLVTSRDQNTITSFEVQSNADHSALTINCGQGTDGQRCGSQFIQHSGLLERSSEAPYGLSFDGEYAYLSHINTGAVSAWRVSEQAPYLDFACQLQVPGANLITQHPNRQSVVLSDRFGRSVFQAERIPQSNGNCQLRLLSQSTISNSSLNNEHQGIAFNADGSQLYVVSSNEGSLKVFSTALREDGSLFKQQIANIPVGQGANIVRVAGQASKSIDDESSLNTLDQLGQGLVYVTSLKDGTITVIDPQSLTVLSRIEVGRQPHDIAFVLDQQDQLRAYVTLFQEHKVAVIDLQPDSASRFTKIGEIK